MTRASLGRRLLSTRAASERFWRDIYLEPGHSLAHGQFNGGAPREQLRAEMLDLLRAPPYVVTTEMVDVLDLVRLDIMPFELHPTDLLTEWGLALFERPISVAFGNPDGPDDVLLPCDGMGWIPDADGSTTFVALTRIDWMLGEPDPMLMRECPNALVPMHPPASWGFGVKFSDTNDAWHLTASFLRLVQEHVVVRVREQPDRITRRQAIRAGIDIPELTIVTLRRQHERAGDAAPDDARTVEWSHRWTVRSHWRNQWYPSQNRHAPKLIPMSIKGPEGLPLVIKERRFEVVR